MAIMVVIIVGVALALCGMREGVSTWPKMLLLRQMAGHVEKTQSQRKQHQHER